MWIGGLWESETCTTLKGSQLKLAADITLVHSLVAGQKKQREYFACRLITAAGDSSVVSLVIRVTSTERYQLPLFAASCISLP